MPSDRRILVGCVQQYCYCRERKYCPFDDLNDFGHVIRVKENAPELLRRALSRLPVDVIATGDYQAAEQSSRPRAGYSRCAWSWAFPSRSWSDPPVLGDLDLLEDVNKRGAQ